MPSHLLQSFRLVIRSDYLTNTTCTIDFVVRLSLFMLEGPSAQHDGFEYIDISHLLSGGIYLLFSKGAVINAIFIRVAVKMFGGRRLTVSRETEALVDGKVSTSLEG